MQLDQLRAVLQKNPTIYTKTAKELSESPAEVEEKYRHHVQTHMSLPDLEPYVDRMLTCLLQNQSAFAGGLFGDYGLGKTSTSIYFWKVCEDRGLLAVPPYEWTEFRENFDVLYSWTKYRLSQVNPTLVHDLDRLRDKYTSPSLEAQAQKHSSELDIPFDKALAMVTAQWEQGVLKLDLPETAYLDFMSEVSLLVQQAHFKGVIVFMDEVQATVEALSLSKVADILFKLAASIVDRTGHYGLFVSMPLGTQTALLAERKDIFDRLQRQKCFIDLSVAYSVDFPARLWKAYAEMFEFQSISDDIVAPETLAAIGQVCDTSRPDLGNGPRSVISAFNRIMAHYGQAQQTYGVEGFVEDCLKGEIVLGQQSRFAKVITDTLNQQVVRGHFERLVKVLAGFPAGAPVTLLRQLGVDAELTEATQKAYGELVSENANGYVLLCLGKAASEGQASVLQAKIRQYYRTFSVDSSNATRASEGFRDLVLPYIFKPKDGLHGFQAPESKAGWTWAHNQGCISTVVTGTFENATDYPQRVVRLNISHEGVVGRPPSDDENLAFSFNLKWKDASNRAGTVADLGRWFAVFHLDMLDLIQGYGIPTVPSGSLPSKLMTPFFLLGLAQYLRTQANVPKTEQRDLDFVVDSIVSKVTLALFSVSLLDVQNTQIKLNNQGRLLVADLFWALCKRRYPKYHTLITQPQWQRKIQDYVKILQLDKVTLNVARGNEPLDLAPDQDRDKKRQQLAQVFNVNVSSLETWGAGIKDLLDLSKSKSEGVVNFRVHPLEEFILGLIKACPDEHRVKIQGTGKLCQAVEFKEVISQCRTLGYTDDEIQMVMGALGQAREFFKAIQHGGRQYVYYEPVSTDELRDELQKKLTDLGSLLENLKVVRGFNLDNFPFADLSSDVPRVQSVEDYERIRQPVHGHFERINRWIGTQFDELAGDLERAMKERQNEWLQLENGGSLGLLKHKFEGQATWFIEVTQVQAQVQATYQKLKNEWDQLQKAAQQAANYGHSWASPDKKQDRAKDGVIQLVNFQQTVDAQCDKLNAFKERFRVLKQDIQIFGLWQKLKDVSNQTLQAVMACQQLGDKSLVNDFMQKSSEIRDHLEKYGREGLHTAEGFLKELQELFGKAEQYRAQQRKQFLAQKDNFHQLLKQVRSNTSILRSQFDDANPAGSYVSLCEETWEGFRSVLAEIAGGFAQLQNDVQYAAEYLDRDSVVHKTELTEKTKAGREWAEELQLTKVTTEGSTTLFEDLVDEISKLRDSYATHLGIYRQKVISPADPSPEEAEFLEILERNDRDLKELILALKAKRGGAGLNEVLEMLSSLFRKNQLVIKVKRSN